ncbi:MAG: hypothetical protein ACLS63_08400 [Flavonifractor plautii]
MDIRLGRRRRTPWSPTWLRHRSGLAGLAGVDLVLEPTTTWIGSLRPYPYQSGASWGGHLSNEAGPPWPAWWAAPAASFWPTCPRKQHPARARKRMARPSMGAAPVWTCGLSVGPSRRAGLAHRIGGPPVLKYHPSAWES